MLETVMHELTQRQKQVLDYIIACIDQHGYPPTQREISEHIGTSGTVTALRHLEALERKGHISRRAGSSRSIVVTGRSGVPVSLPIVGLPVEKGLHDSRTVGSPHLQNVLFLFVKLPLVLGVFD